MGQRSCGQAYGCSATPNFLRFTGIYSQKSLLFLSQELAISLCPEIPFSFLKTQFNIITGQVTLMLRTLATVLKLCARTSRMI